MNDAIKEFFDREKIKSIDSSYSMKQSIDYDLEAIYKEFDTSQNEKSYDLNFEQAKKKMYQ